MASMKRPRASHRANPQVCLQGSLRGSLLRYLVANRRIRLLRALRLNQRLNRLMHRPMNRPLNRPELRPKLVDAFSTMPSGKIITLIPC